MHTEREPIDVDTLTEMGYERRDINFGALTKWIVAFFVLGFVFFLVSYGFFAILAPKQRQAALAPPPKTRRVPAAPNPLLQNNIETKVDIERMRRTELDELTSYSWVDQGRGIVRLPIERAKALLVQRGMRPTGRSVAPTAPAPQGTNPQGTNPANAGNTAPSTQSGTTTTPGVPPTGTAPGSPGGVPGQGVPRETAPGMVAPAPGEAAPGRPVPGTANPGPVAPGRE